MIFGQQMSQGGQSQAAMPPADCFIQHCCPTQACAFAGDHLYRMNYQDFVNTHRVSGADITVAALPTSEKLASAFGLMKIDGSGRIVDFAEKPQGDALRAMAVDTTVLGLAPER